MMFQAEVCLTYVFVPAALLDNDDWKNIDVIMTSLSENLSICYPIFKDRKNKEAFGFWVKFFGVKFSLPKV